MIWNTRNNTSKKVQCMGLFFKHWENSNTGGYIEEQEVENSYTCSRPANLHHKMC